MQKIKRVVFHDTVRTPADKRQAVIDKLLADANAVASELKCS